MEGTETGGPKGALETVRQLVGRLGGRIGRGEGHDPLAQAVRIIQEEIGQLQELVQEPLKFIRPVERRRIVPVDLNALLASILTVLTANQDEAAFPVSVKISLDHALPQLPTDYEEIKRAFRHILKKSYAALSEKEEL
jgi:nitrogen-specific signal transduction histidine kinase